MTERPPDLTITVPGVPVPAPRQTQRDRWRVRPAVARYREYRDRIIDELKRLKGEHRSVMLVSHLLEDLEACCDRVLVMEDGGVGS